MELEAENWRLCSTTLVRGVSVELEDEHWRLCSTTVVRGVTGGLGGLRATSFISSDRSLLRDTSCVAASALFCLHSGSSFSVRLRRVVRPLIESADQRSRLRPNCLMLNQGQSSHVANSRSARVLATGLTGHVRKWSVEL